MASKKTIRMDFDSVMSTNVTPDQVQEINRWKYDDLAERTASWWGAGDTAEEVRDLIAHGWKDGVNRMLDAMGKFGGEFHATSIKRQIIRGDYGDELDIHRVYSGSLGDAWTRRKRQRKVSPSIVTIGCNLAINGSQSPDELFWRGAAVLRLADVLTEAGYSVEIVAWLKSCGTTESGKDIEQVIRIKESSDPLDLNSVASTLCLAGFLRLNMFQNYAKLEERVSYGLGKPEYDYVPAEYKSCVHADGKITSQRDAEQWLKTAIAKFSNEYQEAA